MVESDADQVNRILPPTLPSLASAVLPPSLRDHIPSGGVPPCPFVLLLLCTSSLLLLRFLNSVVVGSSSSRARLLVCLAHLLLTAFAYYGPYLPEHRRGP